MTYVVKVHKRVLKFIQSTPKEDSIRIKNRIAELENPYKTNFLKIRGEDNVFRMRVGNYRILFSIFDEYKIVLVVKVDKRSKIYKRD